MFVFQFTTPIFIKISDFGFARNKTNEFAIDDEEESIGSLPYIAPEIHLDRRTGQAYSDIWSMGATLVR